MNPADKPVDFGPGDRVRAIVTGQGKLAKTWQTGEVLRVDRTMRLGVLNVRGERVPFLLQRAQKLALERTGTDGGEA